MQTFGLKPFAVRAALLFGLVVAATAHPQSLSPPPAGPIDMPGPPGLPDVSGGRFAIISLKDLIGTAKGSLPLKEPKFAGSFRKAPADRILSGDPDGWMADLEAYRRGVKRAEEVLPKSNIALTALAGTAFDQFTLLGYLPEGTRPQGPWSMIGRLFSKPPGELVYLKEWDFGLDDGGVIMFDELLNTTVGNNRASIMVTRSDGTTQTQVRWVSGTRQIEILATCKLTRGCADADEWRDIAGTLPAALSSKAYPYKQP
jgi:hypothetical protein